MKALILTLLLASTAFGADYPVIAVRQQHPVADWPEVFDPVDITNPGQLVRRNADGSVDVLVDGIPDDDGIVDPVMSLDGGSVYYVRVYDVSRRSNWRHGGAPNQGADVFRYDLEDGTEKKITDSTKHDPPLAFGDFTEHAIEGTDARNFQGPPRFGWGVFNMGPCPLPDGRLVFTSNRLRVAPTKNFTAPSFQIFRCDADGQNVEPIWTASIGSALHPRLMKNGRVLFSSYESQGLRDRRIWAPWSINPDGSGFGPEFSGYGRQISMHFQTQLSDGTVVVCWYYNMNNNGFGTLVGFPAEGVTQPMFQSSKVRDVTAIQLGTFFDGKPRMRRISTARKGYYTVTPWIHERDTGNADGKVTHPSGAPDNELLVTYSPGPANRGSVFRGRIGLIRDGKANTLEDMQIIVSDDEWDYMQPIAAVSRQAIYGEIPPVIPDTPNPSASPFALIRSASAIRGQWKSGNGKSDPTYQGFWSGSDAPVKAIRIIVMQPNVPKITSRDRHGRLFARGTYGWENHANERMAYWDVPLSQESRPEGDTSWAARIPANVPFTLAAIGEDGRQITFAQTWHEEKPGYIHDCGGCHNHSEAPLEFSGTWADQEGFLHDVTQSKPRTVEYHADVKPIFQEHCTSCHSGENASNGLILDASIVDDRNLITPLKAYASLLSKRIHGDDGLGRMPADAPPLSADDMATIDAWIDTGCLVNTDDTDSGRADMVRPTLVLKRGRVGAHDYASGLKSVEVTVDGTAVALTEQDDGTWAFPDPEDGQTVQATAFDKAGNRTRLVRTFGSGDIEPPPPPTPERTAADVIADIEALLSELKGLVE